METKGQFKVNGTNILEEFGVFVIQYGYAGLLDAPVFKPFETVDWMDEDGLDVDLSSPVLAARSFSLNLGFTSLDGLNRFYEFLSGTGIVSVWMFTELGITKNLRLSGVGTPASPSMMTGTVSITLVEDSPEAPHSPIPESPIAGVSQRGFSLDGHDFSHFGCWVLDGSIQSLRRGPAPKTNLVIDKGEGNGQVYLPNIKGGAERTTYRSYDVTLNMLINATSVSEWKAGMDALVSLLVSAGTKKLRMGQNVTEKECFYKSLSTTRFDILPNGHVWHQMTLTVTMINARPDLIIGLLATENGFYVETEDGKLV